MPKRGGKSRGGARGGSRGGGRGGARGGGSFRSYNLSKSSRRRAGKKSAASANHDVPELMDLGGNEYIAESGTSMKNLSKRPNRRMLAEAQYTDKHMAETMAQPMRLRPIEFVKAKDVYDPGRELVEALKKQKLRDDLALDMENLNVEAEASEKTEASEKSGPDSPQIIQTMTETEEPVHEDINHETSSLDDVEGEAYLDALMQDRSRASASPDNAPSLEEKYSVQLSDENSLTPASPGVPVEGSNIEEPDMLDADLVPSDLLDSNVIVELQKRNDDYSDSGDFQEHLSGNDSISDVGMSEVPKPESNSSAEIAKSDSEDDHIEAAMEEFFTIDETGDDDVFDKHAVKKKPTSTLLQAEYRRKKAAPVKQMLPRDETELEHDSHIMVGKVMLKTLTDENGIVSTNLPRGKRSQGFMSLTNFEESYYEEESEETDDEAAFEDYKAQIMGDLEFDDSDSEGYEVPENFADIHGDEFDYGDDGGLDDEEINDSDIYISSDSDLGEQDLNSEEEGLEDILAFARTQQKARNQFDLAPTQTLKKKGKGKKQKLELGSHLELELRESLMDQFQYQKQSRKEKKLRKKEKRQREGIELHDLSIKYDYSLHINEIKQEFEVFLHDAGRETMSFPPLDGHGNKTVSKLAGHYNMKCIRCGGNGLSLFMKVAKTKKTFRYIPAYDSISYIMKQRPIFKRVDVKPRTQEEIASTDGKKDRRGPKSDAVVREGDIVGGKAPEIGNNNIGRQLLEKLGWVKGEGLGAHGNKGISEPLTATVKRSKTGLK
ncbi:hypothetical protein OXX80_001699 [Metschnikowia pulcherrima]